jgi:lysozyme
VSTRKPVSRKRTPKKKKGLSLEWKFAIVALLLVLFSPLYYGYIIKGFTSSWRWIKDIGEDPNYRTYSSFDIRIPKGYVIHGIDVSYYQGKIDWEQVKAMEDDDVRIRFAFIKATEGMFSIDPYFSATGVKRQKQGSFAALITISSQKNQANGRLNFSCRR